MVKGRENGGTAAWAGMPETGAKNRRKTKNARMDEGRKRVLAIVAGILVARHLKIIAAARVEKLWLRRLFSGREK